MYNYIHKMSLKYKMKMSINICLDSGLHDQCILVNFSLNRQLNS